MPDGVDEPVHRARPSAPAASIRRRAGGSSPRWSSPPPEPRRFRSSASHRRSSGAFRSRAAYENRRRIHRAAKQAPPERFRNALTEFKITGATIVSMDPALGVIEGGDIMIDGGKILAIGRAVRDWAVTAIDGRDIIALPGFVNAHLHLWQPALRGIAADWTLDHYFGVLIGKSGRTLRTLAGRLHRQPRRALSTSSTAA